jgi:N-dimethylarginine dimethylaminohydrolase
MGANPGMNVVLFCPPTYFQARDVADPRRDAAVAVDRKRACEEWQRLRQLFQQAGYITENIEPTPRLEDMVFASHHVFVGHHAEKGPFIVPSRMRHPSQRREGLRYVEWFQARGYRVIQLAYGDDYLEGHGDLIWHPDMRFIWAGYGPRSTRGGVEKFAAVMKGMGFGVVPLELKDPDFYHLETCLAPLNADAVLLYPGAFAAEALASIRRHVPRVHAVSKDEALHFVCSGVAGHGKFFTPRLTPALEEILRAESLEPVVVETSEFEKSGGSVASLKLFLPQAA